MHGRSVPHTPHSSPNLGSQSKANEHFKGTKLFSELRRSKSAFSRVITGAAKAPKKGTEGRGLPGPSKKNKNGLNKQAHINRVWDVSQSSFQYSAHYRKKIKTDSRRLQEVISIWSLSGWKNKRMYLQAEMPHGNFCFQPRKQSSCMYHTVVLHLTQCILTRETNAGDNEYKVHLGSAFLHGHPKTCQD